MAKDFGVLVAELDDGLSDKQVAALRSAIGLLRGVRLAVPAVAPPADPPPARHPGATAIANARRGLGITQAVLAEQLGISRSAVTQWETGRASPRPRTVGKLLSLLGLEPAGAAGAAG